MDNKLIKYYNEYFDADLIENISFNNFKKAIEQRINDLITNNFQQFIYVLYKVDVSENKLKKVLQENKQTDAAAIITNLIIERLQQKIDTRNHFKNNNETIPDDEKW